MSYFQDVYLKRVNLDGNTRQERIKTRKEIEFDRIFLARSAYQSLLYQINDENVNYVVSLQPNKYNELSIISNLLMSTKDKILKTGDVLKIYQKVKEKEQDTYWLVLFVENNLTNGHNTYKLICLDSLLNITDEYGTTKYNIPIKFVNASSVAIKDIFKLSSTGYREGNMNRFIICRNQKWLKKDLTFNYNNIRWEIDGIDSSSINDVAYISIHEALQKESEPISSEEILVGKNENFFLHNR